MTFTKERTPRGSLGMSDIHGRKTEKYISRSTGEGQKQGETHKQTERQFVMLSVRRQSGGIVPDLPPAVCHSEGDGHGRPFAPVGWRLLAVPENDDLERRGREFYSSD